MVDETALAILEWQGSRGISIVSSQRKIIFDIEVDPHWPKWQTKCAKLAAKDLRTPEVHQETWNSYLMFGFSSAHSVWNARLNKELRWSYKALPDEVVLLSAMTFSNIRRREYALTMDAIKKQLPSQTEVSLALHGWTSMNKLAITLVIAYYKDQNWEVSEVPLAFDDVDSLFCSCFES